MIFTGHAAHWAVQNENQGGKESLVSGKHHVCHYCRSSVVHPRGENGSVAPGLVIGGKFLYFDFENGGKNVVVDSSKSQWQGPHWNFCQRPCVAYYACGYFQCIFYTIYCPPLARVLYMHKLRIAEILPKVRTFEEELPLVHVDVAVQWPKTFWSYRNMFTCLLQPAMCRRNLFQ